MPWRRCWWRSGTPNFCPLSASAATAKIDMASLAFMRCVSRRMDLLSELAAEWDRGGAAGLLAQLQQELLSGLAAHCRRPASAVPEMLAQVMTG